MELVDVTDSKSVGLIPRVGSSPTTGTKRIPGAAPRVSFWYCGMRTGGSIYRLLLALPVLGGMTSVIEIRYLRNSDKPFWYSLDKHLPEAEFENKVKTKRGYVLLEHTVPAGILRYNLLWDSIPFCTMLYISENHQNRGYGTMLIQRWEKDMKEQGYGMLLTSTRVDETAQHFYRKLGYKDCGGLIINIPAYAQPMELFLVKEL